MVGEYFMYPKGGVTIEDLTNTGTSLATLALGPSASEAAAKTLEAKCGVPFQILDLPIGVCATDRFVEAIMDRTGAEPTKSMMDDRGRLVDIMTDMQHYLYGKTAALFGDPDQTISLTEFLVNAGMKPVYVITGTPGKRFEERVHATLKGIVEKPIVRAASDLFYLHQLVKNGPVDLIIGNTYGKHIARAEGIPFVRLGFPILDRVGHGYFPTVGYRGGMYLMSNIVNTLLEYKDRTDPEERFELVM
jgi:nitrogenase molybdenum-iron protein beta chain